MKLTDLKLPQATPTLYGEDAVNFLKKVEDGLKNPTGLVPTPKIHEAKKLIMKHVKKLNTTNVG